jgi:hypothetical protein
MKDVQAKKEAFSISKHKISSIFLWDILPFWIRIHPTKINADSFGFTKLKFCIQENPSSGERVCLPRYLKSLTAWPRELSWSASQKSAKPT